ncbi:O-antigen ligase family protein [Streptomyces sp. NPDC004059]
MFSSPGLPGLLLTCTALLFFGGLVVVFARFPGTGMMLFGAGTAWEIATPESLPALPVGVSLYPLDILVAAAVLVTLGHLVLGWGPRRSLGSAALAVLLLLVFASVLRGIADVGLETAGRSARAEFLRVLGGASYVMVVRPGRNLLPAITRVWGFLTAFVVVQDVLKWSQVGIVSSSGTVLSGGHLVGGRPSTASGALIVAQTALMLLCLRGHERHNKWLAGCMLAVAALMQHRTVWISTLAMIAGWLLLRPEHAGRKVARMVLAATTALSLLMLALLTQDQQITRSLTESASDERTLQWRAEGWSHFLSPLHSASDWLFGLPFGTGFAWLDSNGMPVGIGPHSYYVQVLVQLGLMGLATLAVLVIGPLLRTRRHTGAGLLLWVLMLGELCFWASYSAHLQDGLLLGLLLRHTAGRQPSVALLESELAHEKVTPDKRDVCHVTA